MDDVIWDEFQQAVKDLAVKCAAPAVEVRTSISDYFTTNDVGFYWNPDIEKTAMYFRPEFSAVDYYNYNLILTEKLGSDRVYDRPLNTADMDSEWWVKVAYSPIIRNLGEQLQFFPSSSTDNIGGKPLASMLASGLLGAGLGYGAGYVGEKIMPDWMQESGRTRKSTAVLGGIAGAGLGAVPGLINWQTGRSFNDPTLWSGDPLEGFNKKSNCAISERYTQAVNYYLEKTGNFGLSTLGGPSFEQEPIIRTNTLGKVLWNNDVNPQLTAMTMGAVYGANQMPDSESSPGRVTPHQMGLFGMSMGAAGGGIKGYVTGKLVGTGLGILTGMPMDTQNHLANAGMVAGVVNNLVPKLFR